MNWLTRIEVDAGVARREKVFDSYAWHRKLWECFPNRPDAKRDFMTRIDPLEGAFRLWVLSCHQPVCPEWCQDKDFEPREIAHSFLSHRFYVFDLKANPTKAQIQCDADGRPLMAANGKRKRGKRVPLVDPDDLRQWLVRKGEVRCRDANTNSEVPGGFRLVDDRPLEISPMVESHFRKKEQSAFHGGVRFRGTLEVTDRDHFIKSYQEGVGSAKGFGFGLLLLAPVDL